MPMKRVLACREKNRENVGDIPTLVWFNSTCIRDLCHELANFLFLKCENRKKEEFWFCKLSLVRLLFVPVYCKF